MAESIVSGAVANVIAKLLEYAGKAAFKQIAPYFGGKHKLKDLEQTMVMILARLHDAERRGEGENEEVVKSWLKRLKRVLYKLEDLLEVVAMGNSEKEQMPGGKLTKPVRLLFSSSSPLKINKKVAQEAQAIMEEMETLISVMHGLNFRELQMKEYGVVHVDNSRETHSFVIKEEMIGRDEEKSKIIAMLLDSVSSEENVSVIPIVGFGGLGKTTLAQLIFNDKDVQGHFELKSWACISDISGIKDLAGKILQSIISNDYHRLTLQQIQSQLREEVNGKRYLLVLDDIWNEDRNTWLELRNLLYGGKHGSKILVTSRSIIVAQNMGTVEPFELEGLPEDKSWELFRKLAFKEGQEKGKPYLSGIGREIIKKCANVPLAVKTIASLLYSMDTDLEWEAFKDKDLAMIKRNENYILLTLKLSYDRLPSELKQCFAYCSLFPKDHELSKQELIYLWMAQGFLRVLSGHLSPEDIGHAYFMQLMRRCFFQDAKCDEFGEIISCKMHDILHDLAKLAAEEETLLVDKPIQQINENTLHVSFYGSHGHVESALRLLATKQMRSFLVLRYTSARLNFGEVTSSLMCLRALYLNKLQSLSGYFSLGELKHLRYLKLGGELKNLPECITRLQNLQTLDVRYCRLGEFPMGFSKLINLRHLHMKLPTHWRELMDGMPVGIGQLTSLRALDVFVVGRSSGLDALATLNSLAGSLEVCFTEHALSESMSGILKDTKLSHLQVTFGGELALRSLQPPPSLRSLEICFYEGVWFPSWGMDGLPCLLPNLVKIEIKKCRRCQHLPSLGQLRHLKTLILCELDALEYIESNGGNDSETTFADYYYFPSLESLTLQNLPELKWWSRSEEEDTTYPQNDEHHAPLLPHLSCLIISDCQRLTLMPLAPRLEKLRAYRVHEKLIKHLLHAEQELGSPITSSLHSSSYLSSLRSMDIGSVQELESLSMNNLCSLESLEIKKCPDLINVTVASPIPMLSLQKLDIQDCGKLTDISSLRQHLDFLNVLTIRDCPEVNLGDLFDDDGVSHTLQSLHSLELRGLRVLPESIGHLTKLCKLAIYNCSELTALPESFVNLISLQSLEISQCPTLTALPESFGSLFSLQKLEIIDCPTLTALPESFGNLASIRKILIENCPTLTVLPESFRNLTSLLTLMIALCPELQRRCEPDGQHWPLIQHIPYIRFFGC